MVWRLRVFDSSWGFRAKIISKSIYSDPAWCQGYASSRTILRNNGFLNKAGKLNFYPPDELSIEEWSRQADEDQVFIMYTTGDEKCLARGYLTLIFKVNHKSQLTDFIFSEIVDIENARNYTKILYNII